MIIRFDIIAEPKGADYHGLLEVLGKFARIASLVIRQPDQLSSNGSRFMELLDSHGSKSRIVSSWPGTQLVGHTATLTEFEFLVNLPTIHVFSDGLYDWIEPKLPEDLALYRESGAVCLLSSSHEGFAELYLTETEIQSVQSHCKGLRLMGLGN